MKMTKSKLRSFRMKQVNSETGGELPIASIVQLSSVPSNESPSNESPSNEYWSNVKCNENYSLGNTNYFDLTFNNKQRVYYSYFTLSFYTESRPEDRPKITDIEEFKDVVKFLDPFPYNFKYNDKIIYISYDEGGVIRKINQSELPLRLIIIVEDDDDDGEDDNGEDDNGEDDDGYLDAVIKTASYFYVDVDIDKNVTLSKLNA
jgi:hypothetical protein